MSAEDYSYIGVGEAFIREVGVPGAFGSMGNASNLGITVSRDSKRLKNFMTQGGGTRNSIERIDAVTATFTVHDMSPANLARGLRGSTTPVPTGAVSGEQKIAHKGAPIFTDKLINTALPVTVGAAGSGTFTPGTDYFLMPGGNGIMVTADSAIANAETVAISYTPIAANRIQPMLHAGKEYELVFAGLNEARSGKAVRLEAFRWKMGPLESLTLINDEYFAGQIQGELLQDLTKNGVDISQYFVANLAS